MIRQGRRFGQDRRLFLFPDSRRRRGRTLDPLGKIPASDGHAVIAAVYYHFGSRNERSRVLRRKQEGGSDQFLLVPETLHCGVIHDRFHSVWGEHLAVLLGGKKPGTSMLTRMLLGAHSRARFLLRLWTAPLLAE